MSNVLAVALVVVAGVPAFALRLGAWAPPVEVATLLFGLGIVGAAFAMSWGAEAAERDIPRALALITVALSAVHEGTDRTGLHAGIQVSRCRSGIALLCL